MHLSPGVEMHFTWTTLSAKPHRSLRCPSLKMFHIIDFVNTCVHRQSPPVVLHSQPHGTLVQQNVKNRSSLGHRAVLVSVECTRYTRALWRTLALYHGVQVTLRFWTFFQHLCLVWLLIVTVVCWITTFFACHADSINSKAERAGQSIYIYTYW